MKITRTLEGLSSYNNPIAALIELLEDLPSDATYNISCSKGDRPWESDTFSISVTYK